MAAAVGIDLSTTNSVIAARQGGQTTVIPNAEGSPRWFCCARARSRHAGPAPLQPGTGEPGSRR
jgi:molecular chaperone DnaK (HSP70)